MSDFEVVKVVIRGEMPEGCGECKFVGHAHPEGSAFCKIGRYTEHGFVSEWINIPKFALCDHFPSWCPLVLESEEE